MAASGSRGSLGQRLLALKEELETKRTQRDELQGELRSLTLRLKTEFGVDTLEQAEKRLGQEETALREMEKRITDQVEEMERNLEEAE